MKLRGWWFPIAVLVLIVLAVPILGWGTMSWGIMGTGACVPWTGT